MLQNVVFVTLGMLGLFVGGEWLVKSAARLASSFGVPAVMIGMTIVAWATSAPELVVSLGAASKGVSDITIGNAIGSNIVNIGLVLGLIGLVFGVGVHRDLIQREMPIMLLTTLLLFVLAMDGTLSQLDGAIMFGGFVAFNIYIVQIAQRERAAIKQELEEDHLLEPKADRRVETARLIGGIALLIVGANLTVEGAVAMARQIGVSELFIGLTLVAVGTSLPEIAASFTAALRRQSEIAVGNIIGSNIANVLGIVGLTALIRPIMVAPSVLTFELPALLGLSALTLLFARSQYINRRHAFALLSVYAVFIIVSFGR